MDAAIALLDADLRDFNYSKSWKVSISMNTESDCLAVEVSSILRNMAYFLKLPVLEVISSIY